MYKSLCGCLIRPDKWDDELGMKLWKEANRIHYLALPQCFRAATFDPIWRFRELTNK